MTVADDLNKLVQLFRDGLLTNEEFQAAKAATLAAAVAPPSAGGPSSSGTFGEGQGQHAAKSAATLLPMSACFAPSHNGENEVAFKHLTTILTNILQNPTVLKYQCLRLDNPILKSQLFHIRAADPTASGDPGDQEGAATASPQQLLVDGAMRGSAAELFLASIGFQYEERPVGTVDREHHNATHPAVERCLVLRTREPPVSPATESYQHISSGLEEIKLMRKRDEEARQRFHEFEALRKSVVMEIRMEKMQQAIDMGEVDGYCEAFFLNGGDADDADVALEGSLQSVDTMHQILANIAAAPNEQRYRELRLGNKRVFRTLVHQRGGLEFLLGVVGFTMSDAGIVALQGTVDDVLPRVTRGLAFLERLREKIHVEREQRRVQQRNDAVEAARAEVAAALAQERAKRRKEEAAAVSAAGTSKPPGNRVPIEEALRQLLGR